MPDAITLRAVVKRYAGGLTAVDGIDLDVPEGICFGILGPNGAGKTTTIRMIYGFIPLTSGEIRVFGRSVADEPREVKASLGVCPQEDNLDPDFSPRRNLEVYAGYYGIPTDEARRRADELLSFAGLQDKALGNVRELSGGMKRRLVFARSLLHRPRLLVLDEPTTGLDPQARHAIWDKVRSLKKEGVTILLTTHYMEEAALLCDRLIIMDHGRILAQGAPRELVEKSFGLDRIAVEEPSGEKMLRRATLEDLFLRLTGRELR